MFKMVFGDKVAVHQNQNVEVSISFEYEQSCQNPRSNCSMPECQAVDLVIRTCDHIADGC
jgi:hypothetical protein